MVKEFNKKIIEVFNRYENKYLIREDILDVFQDRLEEYMEPDANNKKKKTYSIANLYYDTADSYLIRTSLQKPKYKEKLRLRAYGVPEPGTRVYVEIKKKAMGLVNKRRSAMVLEDAYDFLATGVIPEIEKGMNKQVLNEIQYILYQHQLNPMLYLAYERKAYFAKGSDDVRISFDTNICSRRYDLRLEYGIYGEKLLEDGIWLMEIKAARSIPVWLSKLLGEYKIYPTSFSKYGTEYKKYMMGQINYDAVARISG